MSLDGKILARARARLDERRRENEAEKARRTAELCEKEPRLAEIASEMRAIVADAIGYALSKGLDPADAVMELGEHSLEIQEERRRILADMNLPGDYLDDIYSCPVCRDTGRTEKGMCSCLLDIYEQEQKKELSALLKLGAETFDNFNLELYSDVPDERTGISPRENMEMVLDTCYQYAARFGKNDMNLYLYGGTGLGKTFISTCIANVVAESGFSVVYDTASSVFAKYEDLKFGRGDEAQLRADINRYETCDLMIMDDLGTEFQTAFVTSALYTLINTRLTTGKKTVINSNYSPSELANRYSPAVISRLRGEYELLPFFGSDIRLMKE